MLNCFGQEDKFAGTWEMLHAADAGTSPIQLQLTIAAPEKNLLYPAHLKIQSAQFTGEYDLLLVKKGYNQLGIGRNKIPHIETPFSIGMWTIFLNGTFDLGRDKSGTPVLTANRIVSKKYGVDMPALSNFNDSDRMVAMRIRDLLREQPIGLKKTGNEAWQSMKVNEILHPYLSDVYYGIMDTIEVKSKDGKLSFADNNKIDNDTVFVLLNGKTVIDKTDLSRKNPTEEITLDTGQNILVFFADNYGRTPPNTGKLNLEFGNEKFAINFANKADISATFIVAKLFYYPPKPVNFTPPELLRNTKLVDDVHTTSAEVMLAIWDDALEDGDSISLNINGQWLVKGFAVKKKPQFLKVTLQPGQNNIIFVADNLGAIAPNTSILEIIDGKKRKSFMIDTDLGKNNLVRITYDYSP